MAGITEVARRAGVSITTVSRVLNPVSEYPVAAATRRRVLAAASALQYSPSALARALVTRRSHMIGVLLGDIVDPYFAEIVRGIEDVARRAGYLVVVCNTSRDPGTERRYVTALRDYRVDAIIFLGGDIFDPPTRHALERELASMSDQGAVALAGAREPGDLPAIALDPPAGRHRHGPHRWRRRDGPLPGRPGTQPHRVPVGSAHGEHLALSPPGFPQRH